MRHSWEPRPDSHVESGICQYTALMRLLFVIAVVLLAASARANEPSKAQQRCQKTVDSVASKFGRKAEKSELDTINEINRLTSQTIERLESRGQSTDALRASIDRIVDRQNLDQLRQKYVDEYIASKTKIDGDDGLPWECFNRKSLKWNFDNRLDSYKSRLKLLTELIENRLELEDLRDNEGLLIVAINSNAYIDSVQINRLGSLIGGFDFGPVANKVYFQVLKVREGRFRWGTVTQRVLFGRTMHKFSDREYDFEVLAGKLNYAGLFDFDQLGFGYSRGMLHDRPAIVLAILEERYPELLEQYEIANGLVPNDPFIPFYLAEKSAAGTN